MNHTMHTVMEAVLKARAEGGRPLPVLTSNQCHALAQELNKLSFVPVGEDKDVVINGLRAEIKRLRDGGQVTRGEIERLEEFKRQVRENRR